MKDHKYAAFGLIGLNALQVAAADEGRRLYGTPDSIQTHHVQPAKGIRLPLNSELLPAEVSRDIEEINLFWHRMVAAGGDVDKYAAMYSHSGFSTQLKERIQQSYEHRFLMALADPKLTMYARKGDYESLVHELRLRGVFASDATSALASKLSDIIRTDPKVRLQLERAIADIPNLQKLAGLQPGADLQQLPGDLVALLNSSQLSDHAEPHSVGIAAVAIAFVAVVAATWVAVDVNILAIANAAVYLSVYGEVAVCGWGADCGQPDPPEPPQPPPGGDECVGCQDCTDQCRIVGGFSAPKPVILLSKSMEKNHCVMSAFSLKVKSTELQRRNRIELEKQQAVALFSALRTNGIIRLNEDDATAMAEKLSLMIEHKYQRGTSNAQLSP